MQGKFCEVLSQLVYLPTSITLSISEGQNILTSFTQMQHSTKYRRQSLWTRAWVTPSTHESKEITQINELLLIDNMEYKITCSINHKSPTGVNLHNLL